MTIEFKRYNPEIERSYKAEVGDGVVLWLHYTGRPMWTNPDGKYGRSVYHPYSGWALQEEGEYTEEHGVRKGDPIFMHYKKDLVAYAKKLYENGGHLARYPERVNTYRMPDHVVEADSSISTYRDKDGRLRWDSY